VKTVIVLAGGLDRPAPVPLPAGAVVIAADSGAEQALGLGLRVDVVVGDLDSISAETLAAVEQAGGRVERHPAAKDATDLELALAAALALEPERILVLGGVVGRLDHLFGELLLLAADVYAGVEIDAQFGAATVHVVRGERVLTGEPGELISLFAVHGSATGVVTNGLVYPLCGDTLAAGSSRGLSNVFAVSAVRVSVERGVLLVVRPNGSVPAGSRR
jgi:thiamine pyrophosphokinase